MSNSIRNEKTIYYELLRIIAICCVIFNHTGDNGFFLFTVTGNLIEHIFSIVFAVLCKVGVPIFFMISGALLIPKEETLTTLLQKRVLRIAIVIVLFSFILYVRLYLRNVEYGFGLLYFVKIIYSREFVTPYWFLYSYMATLILLPFIRKMALNMSKKEYLYFFALGILFGCICPIFNFFLGVNLNLHLFILESNIFFFIMGYGVDYMLDEKRCNGKVCAFLWVAVVVSIIISTIMIHLEYKKVGEYTEKYISLFVALQAIVLFYTVKYFFKRYYGKGKMIPEWIHNGVLYVGSCTFGIFLLEEILRTNLEKIFYLLPSSVPKLLICVVYIFLVLIIGVMVVSVLKKIPGFRRIL